MSTSAQVSTPVEPPLVAWDLEPVLGHLGSNPEDFRVDEIPAYAASGDGEHRLIRLEKVGMTTLDLVRVVSRAAKIQEREVGYAGLKDKHAITSQWLSVPFRSTPPEQWELPDSIRILEVGRHHNKLRTGHLRGNRFALRLTGTHPESRERLAPLVERLQRGSWNAFGAQRFGHGGENLGRALAWIRGQEQLRGPRARFLTKFYPSVIQSELFNRYLLVRRDHGIKSLLPGEVVRLDGKRSCFVVDDLASEQARYDRGELHPQGPLFGKKMLASASRATELEREVLAGLGLGEPELEALGRVAPGTHRDVWLRLEGLEATVEASGNVRLSFSLGAGSYATLVARELTREPWLSGSATASG